MSLDDNELTIDDNELTIVKLDITELFVDNKTTQFRPKLSRAIKKLLCEDEPQFNLDNE